MNQRIQDTDVFILKQFDEATKHLKGVLMQPGNGEEMVRIGTPYLERLMANGHSKVDAVHLMKRVFMGVWS